jgi:hypothetical protein
MLVLASRSVKAAVKFHSLTTKDGAAYPVHRSEKFLSPWPLKKDHCSLVYVMLKSSRDFRGF